MYEHYERHRTDNITDPALRRAHPISTISGWDQDRDDPVNSGAQPIESTTTTVPPPSVANKKVEAIETAEPSVPYTNGINKSEQTDDDDEAIDLDTDTVKCACTDEDQQNVTEATEAPIKNHQSISSISDVYNKQINADVQCNGVSHEIDTEEDTTSLSMSPEKESDTGSSIGGGQAALKKSLDIDGEEEEDDEEEEMGGEGKEIVEEIIEEILQKSEEMLSDCQKEAVAAQIDMEHGTTSSPVIKDDEIELAVSEVVKGVREIEMKTKRDNENITQEQLITNKTSTTTTPTTITSTPNTTMETIDTNINDEKTDLSSAIISNENLNTANSELLETLKNNNTVEVISTKEMITTIVNEVIDNCIDNATMTTTATILNDNEICDNNNTDIQVEAKLVVDNILTLAVDTATTSEATSADESNEEIAKSILYEIVDNCIKTDDEENNNANEITVEKIIEKSISPIKSSQPIIKEVVVIKPSPSPVEVEEEEEKQFEPPKVEPHPQRRATSTQVENNHFGETLHIISSMFFLIIFLITQMQSHKYNNNIIIIKVHIHHVQNLVQLDQCLVLVQQDHHFEYPNLNGHIFINVYYLMFYFH